MTKNYAIYSSDPYLLMRMFTDLELCGFKASDDGWNDWYNPFNEKEPKVRWLHTEQPHGLDFLSHGIHVDKQFTLTESNYIEVLVEVTK